MLQVSLRTAKTPAEPRAFQGIPHRGTPKDRFFYFSFLTSGSKKLKVVSGPEPSARAKLLAESECFCHLASLKVNLESASLPVHMATDGQIHMIFLTECPGPCGWDLTSPRRQCGR
jgi:hypothetical protein